MNDRYQPSPNQKPPEIVNLVRFPLPPSANALYATVGRRRVKSVSYRLFLRAALNWMKFNSAAIDEARALTTLTGPNRFIHIDTVFYMPRGRIFCKDGRPKRNDTSNRIKALHDALAEMLGIDDCYLWSGSYDKIAVDLEAEAGVDITMVVSTYEDQRG